MTFFHDSYQFLLRSWTNCGPLSSGRQIISDAKASLGDLRALSRYEFKAERFRKLPMPVMLQIGTESPRDLYVTDSLAAVLPDARIEELPGQAHEGMTTAPKMYAEAVSRFLLS